MASKTVITVMIRFRVLLPISVPFECVFVNKRSHSAPLYGYVSPEVHLPLIAHKRTERGNATLQKQWSYVHVSA